MSSHPAARSGRLKAIGIHLGVMASYLALALIYLRPLAFHLTRSIPRAEQHDVLLHGWILNWTARQLLRAPWRLFDANVFFPYRDALAYTEHLVPEALPVAPLYALTQDPVLTYNVAYLLTFVLGGWGTFLLVRRLTGDPIAGWVAGAFCCYFPAKRWNLAHINTISVHGVPFAMLSLHRLIDVPGAGRAVLAGALVALAGLVSAYYVIYLPLLLLVGVPLIWWAEGRGVDRRRLLSVGFAAVVALAVVVPVLWPYLRTWSGPEAAHSYDLQIAGAADVAEFFILDSLFWGRLLVPADLAPLTTPFFPGLLATALALFALFGRRPEMPRVTGLVPGGLRRGARWAGYSLLLAVGAVLGAHLVRHHRASLRFETGPAAPWLTIGALAAAAVAALVAAEGSRFPSLLRAAARRFAAAPRTARAYATVFALAILIALGPRLKFFGYEGPSLPYRLIYDWVPGAGALRAPFRAAILGQAFLAVVMGFGTAELLRHARRRWRWQHAGLLGLAMVAWMAIETVGHPLPLHDLPRPNNGVYSWLASQPDDFGILEWPIPDSLDRSATGQWLSTYHWKRRVTGHNGRVPEDIHELFELSFRPLSAEFMDFLVTRFPVRYVVVHLNAFDAETRAWLLEEGLPGVARWWEPAQEFGDSLVYRVRNGGESGVLERRLADWMLPGTLVVQLTEPLPDRTEPWQVMVSLESETVATAAMGAGSREVRLSLPASPLRGPVWLRLALTGPAGASATVERLWIEGTGGSIYP